MEGVGASLLLCAPAGCLFSAVCDMLVCCFVTDGADLWLQNKLRTCLRLDPLLKRGLGIIGARVKEHLACEIYKTNGTPQNSENRNTRHIVGHDVVPVRTIGND